MNLGRGGGSGDTDIQSIETMTKQAKEGVHISHQIENKEKGKKEPNKMI